MDHMALQEKVQEGNVPPPARSTKIFANGARSTTIFANGAVKVKFLLKSIFHGEGSY